MASIQNKYIGLLGGSFDPPHKGHLGISKIAIKKLKLEKIYWVITKKNPFKNKTFYSLDERIKYANKISKSQKKILIIHLENAVKSSRTIDIINKNDEIWYNNWINDYKNYKKVYKPILNKKIEINEILNKIAHEIKKN